MLLPKISIVMPVYNAQNFIFDAVQSCLNQSESDGWELIIINDGSTDNTQLILEQFSANEKIRILMQQNKGSASARNFGISQSHGEFIAFLDADDIYLKNTIRIFLQKIKNYGSQVDIFYCDYILELVGSNIRRKVTVKEPMERPNLYHQLLIPKMLPILTSTVLIRKSILKTVTNFREEFKRCQDLDLWMRLAPKAVFAKIGFVSTIRRDHNSQVSKSRDTILYWREMANISFLNSLDFSEFCQDKTLLGKSTLALQFGNFMLKSSEPLPFTAYKCFRISQNLIESDSVTNKINHCLDLMDKWNYKIDLDKQVFLNNK